MENKISIKEDKRLTADMRCKLDSALNLAIDQMYACGLKFGNIKEVSVNFRAKRWGICKYDRLKNEYYIEISHRLLDEGVPERSLIETVLHEICHTIPQGSGHTGAWKKAVNLLNYSYGYHITRVSSAEEKGINEEDKEVEYKYIFRCSRCGRVFKRQRKSQFVKHPERYRCICGGRILICQPAEKNL